MTVPDRRRHNEPTDPGGEPVCLLTPEGALSRRVPIDRLLTRGTLSVQGSRYEITLPAGEESWALANQFADEEATCCASLTFDLEESDAAVVLRASF